MESTENVKEYHRYLSPIDVWGMAFGCMVGWGAFVMPGTTFLPVAGPAGTVIAMAIGVAVILLIGNNFAYLMNRSPGTGGVYSYTKEAFGRDHAFLGSWFLCLSYLTVVFLNGTALFIVLKTLFGEFMQTGAYYTNSGNVIYFREIVASVVALAGVGILFIAAKPVLQRLHTLLSLVLIAGVACAAVICLSHADLPDVFLSFGTQNTSGLYGIFSIVFLAPWAFVGFDVIAFDSAHFKFPVKRSKSIIITSVIFTGISYAVMTLVSVTAIPDGFESSEAYISSISTLEGIESVPTFYAVSAYAGTLGKVIIGVTALCGVLTGIIGGYRATMRILSTMAEDKILADIFSKSNPSILFIMFLSIALALLGRNTLSWFVDLTSFGAIVGFGYTSAAAYKLSKSENHKSVMVTGIIGTAISAVFVVVQLVPSLTAMETMGSEAFLLLSFWCLLGFVFYWRTVTRSKLAVYSGISTSGFVLFFLLMYSAIMWLAKLLASLDNIFEVRLMIVLGGSFLMLLLSIGLAVMLYIQNLVRKKHEESERDKIRAVEGSLAKSQFLFNMSHDIRTPMNAIKGYTDLALKEPASEELHNYLVKIDRSNRHLLSLIDDILQMSRIESGHIELEFVPCDLCKVFYDVCDLFGEQMKQKQMDFQIHTSRVRNRFVWCDTKNLNRVLCNLIGNSYKFTPESGLISASIIESSCDDSGYSSYELRVRDTGIGMSSQFVSKMFSPFERERTSTVSGIEGTGLGLSITKSIVDLMGGTIEVITSPGSGTEMIIRLKLKLAHESDIPEEKSPDKSGFSADVDFTGVNLLLVEDNAINMEIAKMILTQHSFTVETAENGQIALDMVSRSEPGYYGAVLMDIQMPVMDGYTAARKIRALENKALSEIPMIAMTANAFKEDEEEAGAAGMQYHISKPIDVDILIETLSKVLPGSGR